ncbi:MAG: hypothetical protein ACJ8FU_24035 [Xanthobacteraceae bacterium]
MGMTMPLPAKNQTAKRVVSSLASFVMPVIDILSRREEKTLTAEIERWIVAKVILFISFSYPKSYPASKPCPERVVFKGDGWRAVYLEKGMKLTGRPPDEIGDLLRRLGQEHILNLQNLLRFLCEHSRKVRTEVDGFDASSAIVGYVQLNEMSTEKVNLQVAATEGFELDFKWEVVKVLPA